MTSCRCTCTRSRWWAACSVTTRAFASRRWASPTIPKAALLAGFFKTIERYTPKLVSWNGSGFDLPVLHYRSLILGVPARYWDMGEEDREFKFNNYISRYHSRHTDLMDLLASTTAAPTRRWTNWPSSAAFPASWAWTAARSGKPGARAAPTRCGPIADRRGQHLAGVHALSLPARRTRSRLLRGRDRPGARHAVRQRRSALEGIPGRLERVGPPRSAARFPPGAPLRTGKAGSVRPLSR